MAPPGRAGESARPTLTCRPEPFAARTTISYELAEDAAVRLAIYAPNGRLVRSLVDERPSAGRKEVDWNGRDAAGDRVASGVHLCLLDVGSLRLTRPAVLVK